MQICYPAKCKFTTQATQYGINNEKVARDHLGNNIKMQPLRIVAYFEVVNFPSLEPNQMD